MRFMELLDSLPGNRKTPDGEKVTMLTCANADTIETLAFNIRDSKALVVGLLVSLADAGSPVADECYHAFFASGYPKEDIDSDGEKGAAR